MLHRVKKERKTTWNTTGNTTWNTTGNTTGKTSILSNCHFKTAIFTKRSRINNPKNDTNDQINFALQIKIIKKLFARFRTFCSFALFFIILANFG